MLVVNVYLNKQVKNPYYLIKELTFFNKAVYIHVMLLGFILNLEQLKVHDTDVKKQMLYAVQKQISGKISYIGRHLPHYQFLC